VGARAAVAPDLAGRPLSLTATARFGPADRHLNGRVDAERGSLSRTVTLSGYHELEAVERGARHLGIGNSLIALLGGRDDGDYFRRSGASLTLTPPASGRAVYRVAIHSEYHEPVRPETRTSLVRLWEESDWSFRENVRAREGWEHAVEVTLSPWWGTDPTRAQFGLSWSGGAALGDLEHARSSLLARAVIPVAPAWRLGLAAGAGAATSNTPAQRTFGVGGATTLRGYDPRTLTGPCTGHARVEIQRAVVFGGVAAFADAGWAGACDGWDASDALRSLGVGASILDGLIRFDLAHGLDDPAGFRLELYLDGIL